MHKTLPKNRSFFPLFTFRRPIFSLLINSLCVSWVFVYFVFSSPFSLRWINMDSTMFIFSMFSFRRNLFFLFPNNPSKYLHRTIQSERIFAFFSRPISFCPKVCLAFFMFYFFVCCNFWCSGTVRVQFQFLRFFFCCSNRKYQKM